MSLEQCAVIEAELSMENWLPFMQLCDYAEELAEMMFPAKTYAEDEEAKNGVGGRLWWDRYMFKSALQCSIITYSPTDGERFSTVFNGESIFALFAAAEWVLHTKEVKQTYPEILRERFLRQWEKRTDGPAPETMVEAYVADAMMTDRKIEILKEALKAGNKFTSFEELEAHYTEEDEREEKPEAAHTLH